MAAVAVLALVGTTAGTAAAQNKNKNSGKLQRQYTSVGGQVGFGTTITDIPANPYGLTFGAYVSATFVNQLVLSGRIGAALGPPGEGEVGERYDYFTAYLLVDTGYEWTAGDWMAFRPVIGVGLEMLGGGKSDRLERVKPIFTFLLQPSLELLFRVNRFEFGVKAGLKVAFWHEPQLREEVSFPVSVNGNLLLGYRL